VKTGRQCSDGRAASTRNYWLEFMPFRPTIAGE
jgi:hypothetical protein